MPKAKPVPEPEGLPDWVYHIIIAILFSGVIGIALYVWSDQNDDTAGQLEGLKGQIDMIDARVTRTNDRQTEMSEAIIELRTELRIHQNQGK